MTFKNIKIVTKFLKPAKWGIFEKHSLGGLDNVQDTFHIQYLY